jgi:hypothetical protein
MLHVDVQSAFGMPVNPEYFSFVSGSVAYDLFTKWPGAAHCNFQEERHTSHG